MITTKDDYTTILLNACTQELQAHNQPVTAENLSAMVTETEKQMGNGHKLHPQHTQLAYWKPYHQKEIIKASINATKIKTKSVSEQFEQAFNKKK